VSYSSSSVEFSDTLTPENAPKNNWTSYAGSFPSENQNNTANTTTIAAHAAWHFAQTFFVEFPEYKPNNNKISIWTESVSCLLVLINDCAETDSLSMVDVTDLDLRHTLSTKTKRLSQGN